MTGRKAPLWNRLLRVYREKGPGGVWFGALSKVGYRRLVLLERRLDEPVTGRSARAEVRIRLLAPGDEAAFVELGQGDAEVFRQRMEQGHECWGAWCAGGLRHVAWIGFRDVEVEYLACRLLLADRHAYVYRAYTEPAYRRLGLGPAAHSLSLRDLQRRGFERSLAAVLPDNPWAYPPWLAVGYRRAGAVRAIGCGARPHVLVAHGSPAAAPPGWRFVRADRRPRGASGPT